MRAHKFRERNDKIVGIVRHRLRIGECFFLGTKNKDYWRNIIERDLTSCTIEDWDDGLVIRRE